MALEVKQIGSGFLVALAEGVDIDKNHVHFHHDGTIVSVKENGQHTEQPISKTRAELSELYQKVMKEKGFDDDGRKFPGGYKPGQK
jgi:hypothetical protein